MPAVGVVIKLEATKLGVMLLAIHIMTTWSHRVRGQLR
uniref:Uncharacterized protein n=1 Tax=Aegilops tauschii subsp. strangulata TaxID=200361 RepID=A0A453N205_AEGTS